MRRNQSGQSTVGIIAGVVAFVVVVTAVVLIGWNVGWWFSTQNANRQAHLIRHGYSNQQTLREQITKNLGDVQDITTQIVELGNTDPATKAQLSAQRKAVVSIVCQNADEVTGDPLPADQAQFVSANCQYGSISPDSQYNN